RTATMTKKEKIARAQAPVARAHHYVPGFYLAGFTPSGRRDDFLWVHDGKAKKGWRQRPREVACEKDFYRVDAEGLSPDVIEQDLAKLESACAQALARVLADRTLPSGETLAGLVGFVTLLIVRTPSFREMYLRNTRELIRFSTRFGIGHPEAFKSFQEEMAREGKPLPDGITQESLLAFLDDESRYTIEIPQLWVLKNLFDVFRGLYPLIAKRTWSLVEATEEDFICSDNPVSLVATSPDVLPHFGFGIRDTETTFPLDRSLALVGSFDGPASVTQAGKLQVGFLNRRTLQSALRFAYSAREEFVVSVPREGRVASATAGPQVTA
ncbi:MAG: DUF4238 domain-containing protein, partial [Rhodocyclaceae bacterium]|nr:DUF4238 domain-containing protein [Rhodocyclaceae bacterium]